MSGQSEHEAELGALLDHIIPGKADFPAASATSAMRKIADDPIWNGAVSLCLEALAENVSTVGALPSVAALTRLEQQQPELFNAMLAAVYGAYYSDSSVLAAIADKTGYRHPPQPFGYALPAFDESILATAKNTPQAWRDPRI
jgi:hypothetical protein